MWSKKFPAALLPSLLLVLNLFFFLPLVIFQGNQEEFGVSLKTILGEFLLPGLIILLLLIGAGLVLPSNPGRRFTSILFALAVLVWIQGNLLVWKYGVLTGQGIVWKGHAWSGWVDAALWIGLLSAAVAFSKSISKIVIFGSALFLILQSFTGIYTSLKKPGLWKSGAQTSAPMTPPQGVFEFSRRANVIQLILDGFQSDFFKEIVARDPEKYRKALDGFTFFEEATSSFPSTQMSVPAILSGEVYKNDIPTYKFIRQINQGRTIGNVLHDRGFDVDLVVGDIYTRKVRSSTIYDIAIPYGYTLSQHVRNNAAQMMDLVLFRASPQPVKRLVYNDQLWLFQHLIASKTQNLEYRLFSHRAFLDDFIRKASVAREKPVYKYLHLMTVHPPILVDEDCGFKPGLPTTWENRIIQARCAFDQFLSFLERLRSLGIYDSSLIILQGDHGTAEHVKMLNNDQAAEKTLYHESLSRIASLALPLLAVKPPGARGLLANSKAEVELTDLPATICSLLRIDEAFKGRSVFAIDPKERRERKFYFYDWYKTNWENEYFDYLDEFEILGSPYDRNSWRLVQSLRSPLVSFKTNQIIFGTTQSNRFKRAGWAGNQKDPVEGYTYNWALGESAILVVSLPKERAVEMTARIKSYPVSQSQIVTIKVDGNKVGMWNLRAPWVSTDMRVLLPPDSARPEASLIEFVFSQHREQASGLGPQAVQFQTITLKPQKK